MSMFTKLVAINLDIHLWYASKKRKRGPEEAHLPAELFTLGAKRIFDKEELAPFVAKKARVERLCATVGVKQIIGSSCFLVPEEKAPGLIEGIKEIQAEFLQDKEKLLAVYDEKLNAWLEKNEEYRDVLEADVLRSHEVEQKIDFKWQAFVIHGIDDPDLDLGLEEKMEGLFDRLLYELSVKATESWENSFSGKTKVTRKAIRPLMAIREKLSGFQFSNSLATPLLELIERALRAIPATGPIENESFVALQSIILLLMNPRQARLHAQKTLDGIDPEKAMFNWAVTKGLVVKKEEKPETEGKKAPEKVAPATAPTTPPPASVGMGQSAPPATPIQAHRPVASQAPPTSPVMGSPVPRPAAPAAGIAVSSAPKKQQFTLKW